MNDRRPRYIDDVRERERVVGHQMDQFLQPYWPIAESLVDLTGDVLESLREEEPGAEHAVALIAARLSTEMMAVQHLTQTGYPVQAYTVVGSMLELFHTAAYIGGDDGRAREYFEHTDAKKAYPGSVHTAISAVGKAFNIPQDQVEREYQSFYRQMCLVKHGNPMAMSIGALRDGEDLVVVVGPVATADSIRLAFAATQQAQRYVQLVLTVFALHHAQDPLSGHLHESLTGLAERSEELNRKASDLIARLEAGSQS